MTERAERDRTVGGGYDYQWDLAAYLVAARAFGRPASTGDSALDGAFDWLGKVASVHFEGEAQDGAAEDVTFHGAEARRLHLQIKEREPGSSWTTGKDDIKKFLLRVGSRAQDVPTRVLFVSNVSADKKLRDLPGSADRLDRFFSGPLSWYARRGEEPTALPDRDDFSVRVATVEFVCSEIEPTALSPDASAVVAGLRLHLRRRLEYFGALHPERAANDLVTRVKDWSIQRGGTRLAVGRLRDEIMDVCGLSASGGSPLRLSLRDYLRGIDAASDDRPSWSDLSGGRIWYGDPILDECEARLAAGQLLLLVGRSASGKTALARLLGHRASERGSLPTYLDLKHSPPLRPAEFVARSIGLARTWDAAPLLVLEDCHAKAEAFCAVLAAVRGQDELVPVVATSRTPDLLAPEDEPRHGSALSKARVNLAETAQARWQGILGWHLREVRGLSDEGVTRVWRSVPWADVGADLWLLKLALDSYDWASCTLPAWGVYRTLKERVDTVLAEAPGVDDLLCFVAGLGMYDIPTDTRALGGSLGLGRSELHAALSALERAGLLEVREQRCRFWHRSLARLHWEMFQMFRATLARGLQHLLSQGAS